MKECQKNTAPFYQCCCECKYHEQQGSKYVCTMFKDIECGPVTNSYEHSVGCEANTKWNKENRK